MHVECLILEYIHLQLSSPFAKHDLCFLWRIVDYTKLFTSFCTCMSSFFIAAMAAIAGTEVTAGGELLLRRLLMPLEEAQTSLE
nr:hypothetical protein Iba_chr02cCG10470 [Ipomoea batatas]GMD44710.1 hypothetical protein Iba_chr10dCG3110 [Ipomoea batatas]